MSGNPFQTPEMRVRLVRVMLERFDEAFVVAELRKRAVSEAEIQRVLAAARETPDEETR